ncbi:FR47-like protein [Kribbella orskensis]|uniref:FR47-like protein n=1 Tax=Kribbella orskensis TaxID=2512216 RepID=A0ABY2BKA5_9ACTN|nr:MULTISPECIES: GNAT family N-acetyltransferase [Kribbella]TCN40424.1 FR47-like protein [Kribbella sp. VKM Ac-2500]TCO23044.1 FR47-like protein [Kribbella orskensis]
MGVRVTSDAAEFQATVFPFLERDPVLHTLIMTNVGERAAGTYRIEPDPAYYASVHDGAGEVIGAAMRTPDRPVYLGALPADLAADVADAYSELVPDLATVAGDRAAVTAFGDRWSELHGTTWTEGKGTRLHKLVSLHQLPAEGNPRPMTSSDVQRAAEWSFDGFGGEEIKSVDLDWAERHLEAGTMWFWEVDGVPVSMVGYHRPQYGVCRVGPVYTPPEHRRHGYAGALTVHVTAGILADGNQACLYTDLANPTSNKIYAQAGYVPVADFVDLTFAS